MSYFLMNPVTDNELQKWHYNKTVNPRTNRPIKVNGKIYQYLNKQFNKTNKLSLLDVITNEEPITLEKLYNDTTKQIIVNSKNYLIWKEDTGRVVTLHYESLVGLQKAKINIHPVTRNIIPDNIFNEATKLFKNNIKKSNENPQETLKSLSLRAFQYFNKLSIYIDNDDFCKLPQNKINTLKCELHSFIQENLTIQQKTQFNSKHFFLNSTHKNILEDIIYLMDTVKKEDAIFVAYLILGGLILVLPKLKNKYPFLEFSFG
ncbi:hypothetical protein crov097 [Cafeteria roenbergensis virus]|uniref:2-cysteine adaptor domain-containing protein n=1 Tax=Cafeteria roenbergensis virus (strain BV-PW1) TaxID=693272 RepID=E3T4L7_CROVB|nr:hypothetical protein crov097 [Cafeteria roenbergensis virus BV-PW1]ADO67130.1 hypothetical protein crov097 [Cafeteria roenbergensis virus BV-PW1]